MNKWTQEEPHATKYGVIPIRNWIKSKQRL